MADGIADLIDAAENLYQWSRRTFRGWDLSRKRNPREGVRHREEQKARLDQFQISYEKAVRTPVGGAVPIDEKRSRFHHLAELSNRLAYANQQWRRDRPVLSQDRASLFPHMSERERERLLATHVRMESPDPEIERSLGEDDASDWWEELEVEFWEEMDWFVMLSGEVERVDDTPEPDRGEDDPGDETEPTKPFPEVREWMAETDDITGKAKRILQAVIDAEGKLSFKNLPHAAGLDWSHPLKDRFNSQRKAINKKIEAAGLSYELRQNDNAACLYKLPTRTE